MRIVLALVSSFLLALTSATASAAAVDPLASVHGSVRDN